jgi:hypothetical protein
MVGRGVTWSCVHPTVPTLWALADVMAAYATMCTNTGRSVELLEGSILKASMSWGYLELSDWNLLKLPLHDLAILTLRIKINVL